MVAEDFDRRLARERLVCLWGERVVDRRKDRETTLSQRLELFRPTGAVQRLLELWETLDRPRGRSEC
jgi:hypothetical protein